MKIKRTLQRSFPYLLIIVIAMLMLWPQLHGHAFVSGYDYYFHMSRTYETAMQIKTGHFSYFLSLFSWNHSARIVNALYGPLGGYFSGLILLLSGSWLRWELSMSWLALFLAGGTMYALGRYWRLEPTVNLSLSVLYMLSEPVSDYVFNQMFAGFGAALLPLLVLIVSEIMTQKDVKPVKLALILVLIIEVHLMTFILSMIFFIPCLIIVILSARQTRCRLIKHLVKGIVLMLVLSFNVWGSILEVFGSNFNHVIPTFPGTHLGDRSYSAILNTYPRTSLSQTPSLIGMGIAVLIIVTMGLWLMNWRRLNGTVNVFMLLGSLSIWLASGYFPWTWAKQYATFFTALVQFPKRFLPMGLILIYLSLGIVLSKYLKDNNGRQLMITVGLILLLGLIGWGWHRNDNVYQTYIHTYHSSQVINWHSYVDMQWQHRCSSARLRNSLVNDRPDQFLNYVDSPVPDYLPTSVTYRRPSQYKALNPQTKDQRIYYHKIHYKWAPLSHGRELITLFSKRGQTTTLPFVKYAHTVVSLNGHVISPKINQIGAVRLRLCSGKNHLVVQYRPNRGFEFGMLVSILVWLGVISVLVRCKLK